MEGIIPPRPPKFLPEKTEQDKKSTEKVIEEEKILETSEPEA